MRYLRDCGLPVIAQIAVLNRWLPLMLSPDAPTHPMPSGSASSIRMLTDSKARSIAGEMADATAS